MARFDSYSPPEGARDYLSTYGWNFNKRLAQHAVSKMKNSTNKHFEYEEVMKILKENGVEVPEKDKYNVYYLYNYFYSDHYPQTLKTEQDIASAVQDFLRDEDGYEGMALTRYYADCIGKGQPLYWSEYV